MIARRHFLAAAASGLAAAAPRLEIGAFSADVTPPIGSPLFTGYARKVVDRLDARGLLLSGAGDPIVIVSVDWCEIRNESYDHWRSTLAKAAGTSKQRVLVSCVHQHDAPYTDRGAQRILDRHRSPDRLSDEAFENTAVERVASELKRSRLRRITGLGIGKARVSEVASNRRYLTDDGKVSFGRTSATRDPAIRQKPEGVIDPFLKMISFWDGDTPVATLSAYSTHPMSYYGQGDVSCDFVGLARNRLDTSIPEVFSIYASGASGDTMAGKYNDGNPSNRAVLAGRMHTAMMEAWKETRRVTLTDLRFRSVPLALAPRTAKGFQPAEMQAIVADPSKNRRQRFDAALGLSWRNRDSQPIDVPCLDFGSVCILLLPAEAFVQYQLWAQQARPRDFVMVLGYSECAPGYIPTAENVRDGYDDSYSWVDLERSESAMRRAIATALKPAVAAVGGRRPFL